MASPTSESAAFDPGARSKGLLSTAFWSVLCLLAFVWWASHYASLVEWLGEWQFDHFGEYYPSLTVALCVALLAAPVLIAVLLRRRHARRRAERAAASTAADRVAIAINSAERGRLFFTLVAIISGVCAFWALLTLFSLPPTEGAVATIDPGAKGPVAEGPARFVAGRSIGTVARLTEDVGLATRVTYVAPVTVPGVMGGEARFFTEVERLASPTPTPRFSTVGRGILRADGVPRELVNLYRAVGVRSVDRPYLLVGDAGRLRWRPIVLAVQLGLLCLLSAVAALLLRRQASRLRRRAAQATNG